MTAKDFEKMRELEQGSAAPLAHSDPNNKPAPREPSQERSKSDEAPFRIPPSTAIAGVLIRDWAEGKIKVDSIVTGHNLKGNL